MKGLVADALAVAAAYIGSKSSADMCSMKPSEHAESATETMSIMPSIIALIPLA
jgi:hypothetical protein